jgi:predicted  nucleic acid-binding Zn-ribbon protein
VSESNLELLLKLQEVDCECDSIEFRLSAIKNHKYLNELESKMAGLGSQKAMLIKTGQRLDSDITAIEEKGELIRRKIGDLDAKLYHQRDLNPKDLQVIASEIEHQKRLLDEVDDEELQLLDKSSEGESSLNYFLLEESKILAQIENLKTELNAESAGLKVRLAGFGDEIAELRGKISEEYLKIYDKIRSTGKPVAIGQLLNGKCTACSVDIATAEINKMTASKDELNYCEQCGCILVI